MKKSLNKLMDIYRNNKENYIVIFLILLSFVVSLSYRIYNTRAKQLIAREIGYTDSHNIGANNVQDAIAKLHSLVTGNTVQTTYLVKFVDSSYAADVKSQAVYLNGKVTKPENPTRDGYTFNGWTTTENGSTFWDFTNNTITADTTLYAKWSSNTYTLTVDPNGGTWEGKTTSQTFEGNKDSVKVISNPSDTPYYTVSYNANNQGITLGSTSEKVYKIFSGWKLSGGGFLDSTIYTYNTSNGTLTAQYSNNKLNLPSLYKSGHSCSWAEGSATGTLYSPGSKKEISSNITYYAVCTTTTHTVTFKYNGEVVSTSTSGYGSTINAPDISSKIGANYEVEGWYENGSKWDFSSSIVTSDITLEAQVQEKSYKITFDSNGGTSTNSQTVTATNNKAVTQPTNVTRIGYTLVGWYNGSNKFTFGTTAVTSNITLKAVWTASTYQLKFNTNLTDVVGCKMGQQECNISNKEVTYGSTLSNLPSLTSTSHKFDGWYIGEEKWENGKTIDKASDNGIIELKAKWIINTYTVSFDSNGGNNAPSSMETSYGSTLSNPTTQPTRNYYEFRGWYKDSDCTTIWKFGSSGDKVTNNITLYAKWNKVEYNIVYDGTANGGNAVSAKSSIKYDDEEISLSDKVASKNGYEFVGWSTTSGSRDTISSFKLTDSTASLINVGDITLYAVYKKKNTLSFDGNGATLDGKTTESCYQYNNEPSCSIGEFTSPSIDRYPNAASSSDGPANKYTIVGFNKDANATESQWEPNGKQTIDLSGDLTYYAISFYTVEAEFYANNNTISLDINTATGDQYLTSNCIIWNKNTECTLKLPTVKGNNNTPNVGLWQVDPTARSEKVGLASNITEVSSTVDGIVYNSEGARTKVFYALTKSSKKTITVTYKKGEGVKSIGKEKDSCTIKDTYNGDIESSCKITLPKITSNDGYRTGKWYYGSDSYNANEVISVTENREYEAIASALVYTVKFDTAGGSTITDQYLKYGEKVVRPENPIRNGYTFNGWYTTSDYKKEFNFETKITTDTIIYAKFKKNSKNDNASIVIKSDDSKSSISLDENDPNNEKIKKFSETKVSDEEKNNIKAEYFEKATDIYVTDTKVMDNEGNEVDASESTITYKIPLPDGMEFKDNIKVFVIKDGELEEISYTIENGFVVFTVKGTGRYVIANYPKSELAAGSNKNSTILINDRLKELVDKYDIKVYKGDDKKEIIDKYFGKNDDVYVFDALLYDVNGDEITSKDDYITYSIPIPSGMSEDDDFKVYRIINGTKKELAYQIEDGKIIFTVKGTGTFAVVKHNETILSSSGSAVPIIVGIAIVGVLSGAGVFIYKKRKSNV